MKRRMLKDLEHTIRDLSHLRMYLTGDAARWLDMAIKAVQETHRLIESS